MLRGRRKKRKSKADSWKNWEAVVAEGKKVNKQVSRDSQRIMVKTDKLIGLITDSTAA